MSQNKTVIQGLSPETDFPGQTANAGQNFYTRSTQSSSSRGTVVPGMINQEPTAAVNEPTPKPQERRIIQTGKPVVGFLYSVSRTPLGEYWPIQMGKNSIGQSVESDIVLAEGTVSSHHATIVTRVGKKGVIAAIKDAESTNGTFINGEPIDFEAEEIHNGDIITIGTNYQCLFLLIDSASLGLAPNKDFLPVDIEEDDYIDNELPPIPTPNPTRTGGFNPLDNNSSWGGGFVPTDGTVGLDGSASTGRHGGTVSM